MTHTPAPARILLLKPFEVDAYGRTIRAVLRGETIPTA